MTTPTPSASPPTFESPGSNHSQAKMMSNDYLSAKNDPPKISKSPSYGSRKSIGGAALFSLITVLFWSFGLGSILLIWLLAKRIHGVPTASPGSFDRFIVVDEGNKTGSTTTLDGEEELESTMRGVLIITAISHFSSMAVVPLMALGAFYVAGKWLDEQSNSREGPTPLQFGLIMQMCSSGTWDSVLMTSSYLFRHWRTKSPTTTRVSPVVYRALFIASAVVFLHYGVIATDLWLTAEIGSLYYSTASRVDVGSAPASLLGTQYDTSLDPISYWQIFWDAFTEDKSSGNPTHASYYEGLNTMKGISATNHITLLNTSISSSLGDTLSMAVIVRPPSGVPSRWSWTTPSIGMTTRCQPAPCVVGDLTTNNVVTCPDPSSVYHPMPLPSFPHEPFVAGRRGRFVMYHPKTGELLSHGPPNIGAIDSPKNYTNPSYLIMNVYMYGTPWDPRSDVTEVGRVWLGSEKVVFPFYLGTCEITLYDVEVSFSGSTSADNTGGNMDFNPQYTLTSPPTLMSSDRAALILTPITAHFSTGFVSFLDPIIQLTGNNVIADTETPGFSNRLSAELAKRYLGFISSMTKTVPAKTVIDYSPKLVSRYPMAGTVSYIAVVYAHGLLAIILFVGMIGKSSNSVVVDEPGWTVNWHGVPVKEERKPVQELLLVHLRLTDPLAIVAEHFSEPSPDDKESDETSPGTFTSAGALSVRADPVEMFGVESDNTMRVEIGLLDDREGGRRFGLNHRKGRLVENLDNGMKA